MVPDAYNFQHYYQFSLSFSYVFLKIELRTLNTNILIADLLIEVQWPEYQIGHDLKQVRMPTYLVTPGCLSMILSVSLACLPCTKYSKAWMFNEWLVFANKAHCVHTIFLVILIKKLLEDTNNTNNEAHVKVRISYDDSVP